MPWRRDKRRTETPQPQSVKMGNITGAVVNFGKDNVGIVGSQVTTPPATDEALKAAIAALRDTVVMQAEPGAQREQAIEQVDALGSAAETDPPNGRALISARDWLRSNLPSVASALGPVLLHPTVDAAITAAIELTRTTAPGQSRPAESGDARA